MAGLRKPRYLKIYDIHSILKYIFLGHKRPNYIQLNPKPKLVVLLYVKSPGDRCPLSDTAPDRRGKSQNKAEKKTLDCSQLVNGNVAENEHNGHLIEAHVNESMPLDDLFSNILKSIDIRKVSLSVITPENLKLIEKHNVTHMFSYTNFIQSQTNFDVSMFRTFLKPTKISPYFLVALDCEMMICENGKQIGRISMADHTGKIIYDNYIQPASQVLDYVERYSGLNHSNTSKGITLAQMQIDILDIIGTNTFLLGHGLEHDLEAMNFYTENVIDTAYLFLSCEGRKTKLAHLSKKYFGEHIQESSHSSREDALCCLKLLSYKICQTKNLYDKDGEYLDLGIDTKKVADPRELKGAKGLRMLEVDHFAFDSLSVSQDVFYIVFYSKDSNNYVAMRQKNAP